MNHGARNLIDQRQAWQFDIACPSFINGNHNPMAHIMERLVGLALPAASYSIIGLVALLTLFIYRLYLHPLSHIPGPKLAAASGLYEFYYDACLGGKYYWEIMRMHDEYGKKLLLGQS